MLKRETFFGECIAECLGTAILTFLGAGSVIAFLVLENFTSYWEMSLLWGLAVTFAIYITGGVTGAHINPAVTLSLSLFRKFPSKKVIPYIFSQTFGGFLGAALAYILYFVQISNFELANSIVRGSAESQTTASIFTTFPAEGISNMHAVAIEIVLTAFLVMIIFACTDDKNTAAPKGNMGALVIGLTVAVIGGTFGSLTGFALNPARDLGPRIFTSLAGWGSVSLPGPNSYFWVPIVAPLIGGILGGFLYEMLVRKYLIRIEINESEDNLAKQ